MPDKSVNDTAYEIVDETASDNAFIVKKYRSFHWLRAGQDTKTISVRVPAELALWISEQTRGEGINATWLVNRALNFERWRIKLLGPNPSDDELENGRI